MVQFQLWHAWQPNRYRVTNNLTQIMRCLLPYILLTSILLPGTSSGQPPSQSVRQQLQSANQYSARQHAALSAIYSTRNFTPIWWRGQNWSAQLSSVRAQLAKAAEDGLDPEDYLIPIDPHPNNHQQALALDIEITAALLRYISDITQGRVVPSGGLEAPKFAPPPLLPAARQLQTGLESADMTLWLRNLAQASYPYIQLRRHLNPMEALAGSKPWPQLPDGPVLKISSHNSAVVTLGRQLTLLKYLPPRPSLAEYFEPIFGSDLSAAVKMFQSENGLKVDGVVGPKTRRTLNRSPEQRAAQIRLNLERLRWLKAEASPRYIVVNIAAFELLAMERGVVRLRTGVIVGKAERHTPVFSDRITALTLSPSWTPTPRIAKEDLLPAIKADIHYLERNHIRVFDGWSASSRVLDPDSIDWQSIRADRLSYRFRQDPGPHNALGQIRFTLTNSASIYLHDTPHKGLFENPRRDFSSGCIRVADALALADFLLESEPDWDIQRLQKGIASGQTTLLELEQPVPIHVTYLTAWVDEKGRLQQREDIYGRDTELARALSSR
ncbi:MAG: L,D-transpeptidase family protein [Gammaproteobacteria bacterium]|nr:L,D-transpeptidase family protein [Gammaproteobacteria bacterium]